MQTVFRFVCILIALWFGGVAAAQNVSLGGFIPFVGIGLTDEFKDGSGLSATFFLADAEDSLVGSPLSGGGSPFHDIALLDTGAATHILTQEADGPNGFDISGNGFGGTNIQQIGGATGLINLEINDPLAIFATGLGNRTSAGSSLELDTSTFRGQSSVATLSAPSEWELPNILGLPMAAQHAIAIRNDEPQIFELEGRTVRTPQVDFLPLGSGDQQGILRRLNLKLRPGTGFIQGPLYIQDINGILNGDPFHENPLSPTVIENGAMMVDVDMANGSDEIQDKEFLFDTGADLTVISTFTAARLGIDPILDTPDFVLSVEGSGGVQGGVPGFYIEELNLDTVGGDFTLNNVPVAVLDVTNPSDPGNIIDGIIGMHLFNGRNLVIDTNPSIGQGGAGPNVYISDPVTETRSWVSTDIKADWEQASNWNAPGVPGELWVARVDNQLVANQIVEVNTDSSVFELSVGASVDKQVNLSIRPGVKLTTFGETRIDKNGRVELIEGAIDAASINIYEGTLEGTGNIFVGNGPLNGAVRNLSGRIEVGRSDIVSSELAIEGDLSNLDAGAIAFDLTSSSFNGGADLLSVSRFAFLAGELEVAMSITPTVGQMFTLITAGEEIFGQFDTLDLPAGFQWDVQYNATSVVLEVLGIGLAGDFNGDGVVDTADYVTWREGLGTTYTESHYTEWRNNYGATSNVAVAREAIPEPTALSLLMAAISGVLLGRPAPTTDRIC